MASCPPLGHLATERFSLAELRIRIPRINDSAWDYQTLSRIWNEARSASPGRQVLFDFTDCMFIRPNAVVVLGGLCRMILREGGSVLFLASTMSASVLSVLQQNGFAHAMGASDVPWPGNAIPYREYSSPERDAIVTSLRADWLGRGWISVSDALADAIMGQVWELFTNAFEHGKSPIGVISCGQFFPKSRELLLSIADFGIGIPANVSLYRGADCSGSEAMSAAFKRGFTTSNATYPRGMGLDLVKEFVQKANGCLEIFSYGGHARIDAHGERYQTIPPVFDGTLVQIKIQCDDRFYRLSNELDQSFF